MVELGRLQLATVEADLTRLLQHALASSEATEAYAVEAIARCAVRALLYGMPLMTLLFLLGSYCCGGRRTTQPVSRRSARVAATSKAPKQAEKTPAKGRSAQK